jgi:hypothetical protein
MRTEQMCKLKMASISGVDVIRKQLLVLQVSFFYTANSFVFVDKKPYLLVF